MRDATDEELQRDIEDEIEALVIGASVACLAVIADRLRAVGEDGASYREAFAAYPKDVRAMGDVMERGARELVEAIERDFDYIGDSSDAWAAPYYAVSDPLGRSRTAWRDHSTMAGIIAQGKEKAERVLPWMVDTRALGVVNAAGEFAALHDYYRMQVADAVTAMQAGRETYDRMIAKAVKDMSRGVRVRYLPYDEAGSYVERELYAAVRTNVMDTFRQTMAEMRMAQGEEFGADGVEVTAHALCAEDHLPYQGEQFSFERKRGYERWDDVQGSLARPLVEGANCGHQAIPIILGVMPPSYSRAELEELRRRSTERVRFTGLGGRELTMTRYQASQYQRGVERRLRQQSMEAALSSGKAKESIIALRRSTMASYRRLCEEAGLDTRMNRTRAFRAL